jgi:hypothetical protein
MKIYIANTTVQNMEFNYRLPTEVNPKTGRMMWSERLYVEKIPAGGQILLGGGREFSDLEVKHIFDHQGKTYGARRNGELAHGFIGMIWDDKPIKVDRIEDAVKQNRQAAQERSAKMLDATAAASLVKQSEKAQETGAPAPERMELEVAADKSKDVDVGGMGSEAVQTGVTPRNRGRSNRAHI